MVLNSRQDVPVFLRAAVKEARRARHRSSPQAYIIVARAVLRCELAGAFNVHRVNAMYALAPVGCESLAICRAERRIRLVAEMRQ
jgi:hypothetical protein